MADYHDDLQRFLNAWDQVQRDMQAQERVQELADRLGLTVDDVQSTLDRIDEGCRRLKVAQRPTRAENVDLALRHGIREGEIVRARCPDCGGELEANKHFEARSVHYDGGPENREPFWSTTCRPCGHRFNYFPGSGYLRRFA